MSHSESIYLGVDGGGTKTEAIIKTQDGNVCGFGLSPGSNPHNSSNSQVITNILSSIEQASKTLVDPVFESVVLGIAGLDTTAEIDATKSALQSRIKAHHLEVYNDGYIGLKSGTDSSHGVSLIASTGSNCFAINQEGQQFKAGDWGYLLGDQGSGFAIGLKIIQLAIKEYDGRKPSTGLMAEINHRLKLTDFASLLEYVYQDSPPIQAISSLAQMTSDEKYMSSPDIINISESSVSALFESFETVIAKSNLSETQNVPVVLVGKLFLARELITKPLSQLINNSYPECQIIIPQISPVEAAVNLAMKQI